MKKREILTAAMELFTGWGIVFFGVLATPTDIISLFYKYVFALIDTFAFVILGVIYFRWEYFRKTVFKRSIILNVLFVLLVLVELLEAYYSFFLAVSNWQIFTVNDIPVVTYANLVHIGFFIAGILLIIDLVRRLNAFWRLRRE